MRSIARGSTAMHCRILSSTARAITLLTTGLALLGAAHAGTEIKFERTGACPHETESLKIDGSRFRSDSRVGGQDSSLLYDGLERLMTTLMHDSREYVQTEVDEDALDYQGDVANSTGNYMNKQMEKMDAQMAQQCEQARKQGLECPMAGMDVRALMQGMMASQATTWRDLERDGEVAGLACTWWERAHSARKVMQECSAKVVALPINDRDRRGLERGLRVMDRYGSNMLGMVTGLTGQAPSQAGLPQDGLVVEQVCFGGDGKSTGRVVASFADVKFDASTFAIPAGYSEMRMSEPTQ